MQKINEILPIVIKLNKKIISRIYYILVAILLSYTTIFAQSKNTSFKIISNPSGHEYWFLKNNNFGIMPSSLYLESSWNLVKDNITYSLNIIGPSKEEQLTNIYFKESFIKYNLSEKTFFRAGKYYRDFSNYLNDGLSSGSMLISNNAEPMPKIGLVSSKNTFNKNISFNFGIAHSVFDNSIHYIKPPYLHEKFIYINIKRDDAELGFGFVHEAMWGGHTMELGKQPSKIKDFLKVFISADGKKKSIDRHANALGNHLGIWDFYYQKTIDDKILKLYYQHFFEDTSSLRFANKWDGLWGIEITNYIPNTTLLIEYIDTSNCCRSNESTYQYDFYYWNYEYTSGWKYKNYILGNPFVNDTAVWNEETDDGMELDKILYLGLERSMTKIYYKIILAKELKREKNEYLKIELGRGINDRNNINIFLVNAGKYLGTGVNYTLSF